jgi:hypothetical protein
MEHPTPPAEPKDEAQAPLSEAVEPGFLVLKMRDGQGVMIGEDTEIRMCSARNNRADIAIKTPRGKSIRRIE